MVSCAFTDVSERVIHITEFGDGDQFSNFEVNNLFMLLLYD